jgi:hypothetical protein
MLKCCSSASEVFYLGGGLLDGYNEWVCWNWLEGAGLVAEGRGKCKNPTLCLRASSAGKPLTYSLPLCLSVAMVTLENLSLPSRPYSLLFNAFRPCWTPVSLWELTLVQGNGKRAGFATTLTIHASVSCLHIVLLILNWHVRRIYVSNVRLILSWNLCSPPSPISVRVLILSYP